MATAKKLPSGNWHIQVYEYTDELGKRHFKEFTAPTRAEVELMAAEWKANKTQRDRTNESMNVRQACEKYIEMKALLSPTTLQGYRKVIDNSFQSMMPLKVNRLTDESVQMAINKEALRISERTGKQVSAKSVINAWEFVSSALATVCKKHFDVTLPRKPMKVHEFPEPSVVLNAIVGTDIELPCLLAFWLSFTMSEIRGLRCSDVKDGTITINRVVVDVDNVPTIKESGKTDTRLRMHRLPSHIMDLIEALPQYQKWLATGEDAAIMQESHYKVCRDLKKLMAPIDKEITFHKLRHMNASVMLALGVPNKYAQERGGWKTSRVLEQVYQHSFSSQRIAVDNLVDNYFNGMLEMAKNTTQDDLSYKSP